MCLRVQVTDMDTKLGKYVDTSLVISIFSRFLGISRTCTIIVFSISGLGF